MTYNAQGYWLCCALVDQGIGAPIPGILNISLDEDRRRCEFHRQHWPTRMLHVSLRARQLMPPAAERGQATAE